MIKVCWIDAVSVLVWYDHRFAGRCHAYAYAMQRACNPYTLCSMIEMCAVPAPMANHWRIAASCTGFPKGHQERCNGVVMWV
jgi:hypothetical protein